MTLNTFHRRGCPVTRPIATILALCCIALGVVMSPLATGTSYAVGSDDFQDLLLPSTVTGRLVDVENGSYDDGATIVTNSGANGDSPSRHWKFNVDSSDSTFTIENNSTGKCVDKPDNKEHRLTQYTCTSNSSQKWYLELVDGTYNNFYIRNKESGKCMNLLNGSNYDGAWVGEWDCDGSSNAQFSPAPPDGILENSANPGNNFQRLAVQHAAATDCQDPTNGKCSWTALSSETAVVGAEQCVSTVWDNTAGTDDLTTSYSRQVTTGYSNAAGFSFMLGASVKWGTSLFGLVQGEVTLSASLTTTYTHTDTTQEATTNATTLSVPPGQYGWVTVGQLGKKVTGEWTFDKGTPTEWKYTATVEIPAVDGTDGMQSVTKPNYSDTAPTDCPSAT
ncbi:RICIN domain-containing protein [Streptomyces sp. bgisy084]|uniref:RICIN domain-containing protein n=1 Tax=unclassified Streptomyces TaxID=2593676 RepID=UPI003D703E27